MIEEKQFCVYLHKRPDETVFYVGKGLISRAHDFARSRRSLHHSNTVEKHGRHRIGIEIIPCRNERQAFDLEKLLIITYRWCGLTNKTDGGEGASGRPLTEKQAAALARGRLPGKAAPKCPENVRLGRLKAAHKFREYIKTEDGIEHVKKMVAASIANRREMSYECMSCGAYFISRSHNAKCCSVLCQQRLRRANGGR